MPVPYLEEYKNRKRVFCCGVPVVIDADPDVDGGVIVSYEGGSFKAPKGVTVYGGFDTITKEVVDVPYTSVTVNGGYFYTVAGSNWGPGTIDNCNVTFNDGYATYVTGGMGKAGPDVVEFWANSKPLAGECHLKKCCVTFNGGEVTQGGMGAIAVGFGTCDKSFIEVNGGKISHVACVSANGGDKESYLTVNGGEIKALSPSVYGTCTNANMLIKGGEIQKANIYSFDCEHGSIKAHFAGGSVKEISINPFSYGDPFPLDIVEITYVPGVIENIEELTEADKEFKVDLLNGQGADMKTVRFYPFPHNSDRIYGVLENGEALDRPCELPMSEQEIRMCLGMGQLFEVFKQKLVLLDESNYNKDNYSAAEYTGEMPCDDCELVYPRAVEEPAAFARKRVVKKKTNSQPLTKEYLDSILNVMPEDVLKTEEPKKEESK